MIRVYGVHFVVGAMLLFAAGFAGSCRAEAAVDPQQLVAPDPGLVTGSLANGLRYAIKPHPSHDKEVIHLYVDAGSKDETDQEQGLAHFLEHMAFNGSAHIPADTLIRQAESLGIAFGRDQNAQTSYFATDYSLDIPNVDDRKLDFAFLWLGDVADGLTIAQDQVDRERGVVLSEYTEGLGPAKTIMEESARFETPGLRSTIRPPIGQKTVLERADAAAIGAFYRKWYRPENALVVAVGDEPVAAVKARIERAFGGWRNPLPTPERASNGGVDFTRPAQAMAFSDPHMPTAVGVCRYSPKPPHHSENLADHREQLADQIWAAAFDKRMADRARTLDAPFVSASGSYGVDDRTVGATCFSSIARLDGWQDALAALTEEIRRLEAYGVTPAEYAYAKAEIIAGLDARVEAAPTALPEGVAASIIRNFAEEETFDTDEEERRVGRLALDQLSPEAVKAMFHQRWTEGSPPILTVVGPRPVAQADLAAVWAKAEAAPPPSPHVDTSTAAWAYGATGAPGVVSSTQALHDPDFTRVIFRNGVVLNLKATKFSHDTVAIHIDFGAGQSEEPRNSSIAIGIAGNILLSGGYEKNSYQDLQQICQGKTCAASLGAGRDRFDLAGATRTEDLGLELEVLTGLVKEPGFRPEMGAMIPTVAQFVYRAMKLSPAFAAQLKLNDAQPKPHVQDLPPEAEVASLKASDFETLLKEPLTQDALEVTIVGDVDEPKTIAMVAATLGALPPRDRESHVRPDAAYERYDDVAPPPQTAYHEGPADQAAVLMTWPVFVFTPSRLHEARVLTLLSAVMQDAVTERIRQKLGKSYSPTVGLSSPVVGDQSTISLLAQTSPDAVGAVQAEALSIAGSLAGGDITASALEQARKPILEGLAKQRTYNGWWLDALSGSYQHPEQLAAARGREADYAAITLDEVRQAAKTWLTNRPYIDLALPQPKTEAKAQ